MSDNPKGRSKGTKNFATLVTITENGKRKKISKLEAAVTQLADDAARGDKKAIQLAFALLQLCEPMIKAERPIEACLIGGVMAEGAHTV